MAAKPTSFWVEAFQTVLVGGLSIAFAIAFTAGLAAVADANNWCCVHSWALMHGSGAVVGLLAGLLGFHIVRTIGARTGMLAPAAQFGVLPHAAYVFGALGTLYFTEQLMWVGLGAGALALILSATGRSVQPFGLAVIGLAVSLIDVASWVHLQLFLRSMPPNVG
jgi:hypothetical protein